MKEVLSFGAGVNSTALLVLMKQDKVHFDLCVFADTGGEHPETYSYVENVSKPFCKDLGLEFIVVGSPTLYQDYWNKHIIPFKLFRSCTDRYKIRPIQKHLQDRFGDDYVTSLGIATEEKQRARWSEKFKYPLIDLNIDREGCIKLIQDANLPIPIKSGCFFCPFTSLDGWKNLLTKHHDLFLKAEAFEKNCRAYPKYTLSNKYSLHSIREAIEHQKPLDSWLEAESCMFCHE